MKKTCVQINLVLFSKDFLREAFVYVVLKVRRACSRHCLVKSLGVEVVKDIQTYLAQCIYKRQSKAITFLSLVRVDVLYFLSRNQSPRSEASSPVQ